MDYAICSPVYQVDAFLDIKWVVQISIKWTGKFQELKGRHVDHKSHVATTGRYSNLVYLEDKWNKWMCKNTL